MEVIEGNGQQILNIKIFCEKHSNCNHSRTWVDIKKNHITCRDCKVELNPVWVLNEIAHKQSLLKIRIEEQKKIIELYNKKKRTKCEHCGKMTKVKV
jgi:hypothetical protein